MHLWINFKVVLSVGFVSVKDFIYFIYQQPGGSVGIMTSQRRLFSGKGRLYIDPEP